MNHDKTGGPAFPLHDERNYLCEGMTLWDWYAGHVANGAFAHPDGGLPDAAIIATWVDNMLAERKKRGIA